MQRRRRRYRPETAGDFKIALGWYTRDGWERMREVAVDPGLRFQLEDSFEAWERRAQAMLARFTGAGRNVLKVPMEVEAVLAWCQAQDRALDRAACEEYVAWDGLIPRSEGTPL